MIDNNRLYRKSAKGVEAMATRQHGLLPKARSILIMVDGKRNLEELRRISAGLGDSGQLLEQLLESGFIEPFGGVAIVAPPPAEPQAPVAAPAAAPASAAAAAPIMTLREVQRYASHSLTKLLGPSAEDICMRIEKVKNVSAFDVEIARAIGILRSFGGEALATTFAADMAARRPDGP